MLTPTTDPAALHVFDLHIHNFAKLSKCIELLELTDIGDYNNDYTHTHLDERNHLTTRIDYIFGSNISNHTYKVHSCAQSDHSIVEYTRISDSDYDYGTGYWKLNESILSMNTELISELIEQLYTCPPSALFKRLV